QLGTYVLILHMSDKSVIDEYVRRINFSGNHVDQLHIGDHQVTGNLSQGCFEQLLFVFRLNFHITPPFLSLLLAEWPKRDPLVFYLLLSGNKVQDQGYTQYIQERMYFLHLP